MGYSTIVLTNHFSRKTFGEGNIKKLGNIPSFADASWDEKIDHFMSGYHKLKGAAEGRLNIIFSAEMSFKGTNGHFLLYGVTEKFLRDHPNMIYEDPKEFSHVLRDNGVYLVQAHPFRDSNIIMKPSYLDGIEVYNGGPKDYRGDIAVAWAEKFKLTQTSGSDFHHCKRPPNGGIATSFPITTIEELIETLKSGNYKIIRDGEYSE